MNRICDQCGQANQPTILHCRACGARLGNTLARARRRGAMGRFFGACFWVLLLAALGGAGYYYFGHHLDPAATDAPPDDPAATCLAMMNGLIEAALAPLDEKSPQAARLADNVAAVESRLTQVRDNPEFVGQARDVCRRLRELIGLRDQHEQALASIITRDFSGLDRQTGSEERRRMARREIEAGWRRHADDARNTLSGRLARLRSL